MISAKSVARVAVLVAMVLGICSYAALAEVQYTITGLGTLGGTESTAYDINSLGQVVGGANVASGDEHAFLYTPGSGMTDLGTLGGGYSWACGINNSEQVVGQASTTSGNYPAFLYTPGSGMTDLGTLNDFGSVAYSINNVGQVVGGADTTEVGVEDQLAWLYSDGVMKDLNSLIDPASGWTLVKATSINDGGQIVGVGWNGLGQQEAFLLTPIPEPATLSLLALGGLLVLRHRRR